MRQHEDELASLGVQVVVVTFERPEQARKYQQESQLPWPILIDHDRRLYQAYGMEKGSKRQILGLKNWLAYAKLAWRGEKIRKPTDDVYQLGGDVLIDGQGIVRFHFVSQRPVDRPPVEELLERIRQLGQGVPGDDSSLGGDERSSG